jgi:hypothetical protein
MAHVATLILLLPLLGFLVVLLNGRHMSESQVGWVATGVVCASFVCAVITFVLLLHHSTRESHRQPLLVDQRGHPARAGRPAGGPALDHDVPLRDRDLGLDPSLLDWLHARREGLPQVLPVPEPLRLLDAAPGTGQQPVLTFVGWEGVGVCAPTGS